MYVSRCIDLSWRTVALRRLSGELLGGCTGDVLGAVGVVAETAGLVVAAARW